MSGDPFLDALDARLGGAAPASPMAPGGAPRSVRNNNPGNLRWDGKSQWQGMTGVDPDGFVQFDSSESGDRALRINIANQGKLHGINTVRGLISKYAPPTDHNDTDAYVGHVASQLGVGPDDQIDPSDPRVNAIITGTIKPVEGGAGNGGAQAMPSGPAPANGPDPYLSALDQHLAGPDVVPTDAVGAGQPRQNDAPTAPQGSSQGWGDYLLEGASDFGVGAVRGAGDILGTIGAGIDKVTGKRWDLQGAVDRQQAGWAKRQYDPNGWGSTLGRIGSDVVNTLPASEIKILEALPASGRLAQALARYGDMALQGGAAGVLASGGHDVLGSAGTGAVGGAVGGAIADKALPALANAPGVRRLVDALSKREGAEIGAAAAPDTLPNGWSADDFAQGWRRGADGAVEYAPAPTIARGNVPPEGVGPDGVLRVNITPNDAPAAAEASPSSQAWADALKAMQDAQGGVAKGAINHPEIGAVDVPWGDDRSGLAKILAKHPEVADNLPSIVEGLPVTQRPHETPNGKFVLEDPAHRAIVAPDFEGDPQQWLVTAFQKKAPAAAEDGRAAAVDRAGSPGSGTKAPGAADDRLAGAGGSEGSPIPGDAPSIPQGGGGSNAAQPMVRRFGGEDHPVTVLGEPQHDYGSGRSMVRVRGADGQEGFVPVDEIFPAAEPAPAAPTAQPESQALADALKRSAMGSRGARMGIEANTSWPPEVAAQVQRLQAEGLPLDQALREAEITYIGAKPALAHVTRNPADQRAMWEGAKQDSIEGQQLATQIAENNAAIHTRLQETIAGYGGVPAQGEAAEAAARALAADEDTMRRGVSQRYAEAEAVEGPAQVKPDDLYAFLANPYHAGAINRQAQGLVSGLRQRLDLFTGNHGGENQRLRPLNAHALEHLRKAAIDAYDEVGSPELRNIIHEWTGLIDDKMAALGDKGPTYARARAAHATYAGLYKDPEGLAALIRRNDRGDFLNSDRWRQVEEKLLGGKNDRTAIQTITRLRDLPDGAGQQVLNRLKARVVQEAYEAGTGARAGNAVDMLGQSPVSGKLFLSRLDQVGMTKLQALFSPEELGQLATIGRAASHLNEAVPGTVNTSGTASALLNALQKTRDVKARKTGIKSRAADAALLVGGQVVGHALMPGVGGAVVGTAGNLAKGVAETAGESAANKALAREMRQMMDPALHRASEREAAKRLADTLRRGAAARRVSNHTPAALAAALQQRQR